MGPDATPVVAIAQKLIVIFSPFVEQRAWNPTLISPTFL